MIYLILDTNIWIYLANSYNPKNENYEDGLHFKLVESLKVLIDIGDIVILTNDIILQEWKRNKEITQKLIEKHNKTLEGNKGCIKNIKKHINTDEKLKLDEVFEKYTESIQKIIQNNRNHVEKVEELLIQKSLNIKISDRVIILAAKRAVEKLAPFKGDKSNSMADAIILLSSIEYIKELSQMPSVISGKSFGFPKSIFVTYNKGDFAKPKDENEVHPELKPLLREVQMEFASNIGKIITTAHSNLLAFEEIMQIEKELADAEYWESVINCEICIPKEMYIDNIVEFNEPIEIENELIEKEDPNQLKLFILAPIEGIRKKKQSEISTIQFGSCSYCSSEYIKCQYCDTISHYENFTNGKRLLCDGCGMIYQVGYHYVGNGMEEKTIKIVGIEKDDENGD